MSTKRREIRFNRTLRHPRSLLDLRTSWDRVGKIILRAKAERRALRGAE